MGRAKNPGGDSVFRTAEVVGDAWSWLVLREAIFYGVTRFNEFRARLGIARATLQARLDQLTAGGLLERRRRSDGAPFAEYRLTECGSDFTGCLATALRWGERWCAEGRAPAPGAIHLGCGNHFDAELCCSECGEKLDARAVAFTLAREARAELRAANQRRATRSREPGLDLLERQRPCSIARTLQIIGDRWSALVIRESFLGTRRFDEFQQRLGIAPNILSNRLARLAGAGLLELRPYQARPLRHEYRLTPKGLDAYPIPLAMLTFGDRWLASGRPRLVLAHRSCGKRFTAEPRCGRCGEHVERDAIAFADDLKFPRRTPRRARAWPRRPAARERSGIPGSRRSRTT